MIIIKFWKTSYVLVHGKLISKNIFLKYDRLHVAALNIRNVEDHVAQYANKKLRYWTLMVNISNMGAAANVKISVLRTTTESKR